jgi:hypothetical protein
MTTIDSNFNIKHTRGDTFDKTISINLNGSAINWSSNGYASATCKVKTYPADTNAAFNLTVDISVNGALRLTSAAITAAPGLYYYDIEFVKTGSKTETWWGDSPSKFEITQDIT